MHQNGPVGPAIWQIGSDGGFFNNPVMLTNPANGIHACDGLNNADAGNVLGGSERHPGGARSASSWRRRSAPTSSSTSAGQAGKTFTMKNFAVIPFPSGGPVGFGAPDATSDGLVMQFRVNQPLVRHRHVASTRRRAHPALRAAPMVNVKPANNRGDKLRQLILVEEEGNTADVDGPGAPDGDGEPVESLINNTKWNGNREGTTTVVPGSTSNGHGDSATETPRVGLDRGLGGRQPDRRRPPDPHPPDPVPGDLAPAVRRRHLPDRLDRGVPRRHLQRVHLRARACTSRASARRSTTPRRTRPAPSAATSTSTPRSTCSQGACAGGACPSRAPEASDAGWKDTIKMFPGEITRIALRWAPQSVAAGGVVGGTEPVLLRPDDGRRRLRRALPHPRPRGQRVHASAPDRQVTRMPGHPACGAALAARGVNLIVVLSA